MGFIISGQATGSVTTTVPGDSNAQNTTLLLSGNGSNNATNNTFVDSSSNNFAITRVGNTTQGTFSPYGDNWSNYFDGSGDYLTTPASVNMNIGTGNFTFETWIFPTSYSPGQALISFANTNVFYLNSSGIPCYGIYMVSDAVIGSTAVALNTWSHIAFVRSGTTLTCYVNGTSVGSITTASSIGTSVTSNYIGSHQGANYWNGYLSNIRVVKGTAVYTGNFTPSTTPLTAITNTSLLTCQSNRFIDNSSNAFTITKNGDTQVQRFSPFAPSAAYSASTIGGSAYFDGSGDYLYAANHAAFSIGSNSASVEMWCYSTNAGVVVMCGQNGGPYSSIRILQYTNYAYTVSDDTIRDTGIPVILNAWTHLVVTITGGTARMFVNGVLRSVVTGLGSVRIQGDSYVIGSEEGIANYYQGYMTDFRLVNGSIPTAYQTSSVTTGTTVFTPPTAPLTSVANTSLLLNYTNGGIVDSSMMTDLETVGNAKISTVQSKFGGSSMAFDGTGDYLTTPFSPLTQFGTGDFTIEFWLYRSGGSVYQTILDTRSSGTASPWAVLLNSSNQPYILIASDINSSIAVPANTWTHIAICRASGTLRIFNDGVQGYSGANSTSMMPTGPLRVGKTIDNVYDLNGYIDDLRITKGYARYTTAFTPPTAALAIGSVTSTTTGAIASGITMGGTGSGMVISSYVAPWEIGGFYQGGYYCGDFVDNGVTYKLLAAPKSTEISAAWGPESVTGFQSRITGPTNSTGLAALGSTYQAATYCENLTSGGYSDWYQPAVNELQTAINNTKALTLFASGAQSWGSYWSSSELDVDYRDGYMNLNRWYPFSHAWFVTSNGTIDKNSKPQSYGVRAFRRVAA